MNPMPPPTDARIEALARAYGQACHDAKSGEAMDAALRALLDAAGMRASHGAQQFMVSSIQRRAGIVTLELVTMDGAVQPPLETGQLVTLSPLGVKEVPHG
jgi:hypothetical protein